MLHGRRLRLSITVQYQKYENGVEGYQGQYETTETQTKTNGFVAVVRADLVAWHVQRYFQVDQRGSLNPVIAEHVVSHVIGHYAVEFLDKLRLALQDLAGLLDFHLHRK